MPMLAVDLCSELHFVGLTPLFSKELLQSAQMPTFPPPCVMGDESIMSSKGHGTSAV